jgi:hypothetical protein
LKTRVQILPLSFRNISSGTFIIGEKKEKYLKIGDRELTKTKIQNQASK